MRIFRLEFATMSDQDPSHRDDGELAVGTAKPEIKEPPFYKVILLNDDYTPMEYVVLILQIFFRMGHEKATQTMLRIHTQGQAVCGIYTRDIAETKVHQVNSHARSQKHPLLCILEEA
jgi:ATP-dependent Clp protease adaptor protein ClpS